MDQKFYLIRGQAGHREMKREKEEDERRERVDLKRVGVVFE